MIDRGEHAEREQRDGERDEIRRQRRRGAAQPAADVEHHHHVAAAPAVGEPARRQREDAEGEERRGAERKQFAVGPAVNHLEADHHGREDQHHVVIDRVGEVVEADRQPPAGFVVQGLRGEKCHCDALGICRIAGRAYIALALRFLCRFGSADGHVGRAACAKPRPHMLIRQCCMPGIALDSTTAARIIFCMPGAIRAGSVMGPGGLRAYRCAYRRVVFIRREVCQRGVRRIGRAPSAAIKTLKSWPLSPGLRRSNPFATKQTGSSVPGPGAVSAVCQHRSLAAGRLRAWRRALGAQGARPRGPRAQADVRRRRLSLPLRRARQRRCARRTACRRDSTRLAFHPRRIDCHSVSGSSISSSIG